MNYDAIVPLDQFGFLAITGRDAIKFMQGYATCDLDKLGEHDVARGAVCNIQGRMVCNFLAVRTQEGLILRLNRALVSTTQTFLAKYIVFSKAELKDLSEKLHCYGLTSHGEDSGETPIDDKDEWPQNIYQVTDTRAGKLLKIDSDRYELWTEAELSATAELTDWQTQELSSGVVWVEPATAEEYIPQMFNLQNLAGISFDKGCYLGQEIVARMQYRGELKKRLHLCEVSAAADESALEIGAKIVSPDNKTLGHLVARSGSICALVVKAGEDSYCLADGTVITPAEVSPTN